MARPLVLLALTLVVLTTTTSPVLARKPSASRRLHDYYPKYGSSPASSGSSPVISTPSSSSPSGSSPSSIPSSTPAVTIPPVTFTPSPVTIPPVTASPIGGYGGYGSRTGSGTSGFFRRFPASIPKILSLVSTLAKLFGPRLLKLFSGGAKPPSLLGAIKDSNPEPIPSLLREASASLINSYKLQDFPLSASQVVTQFNDALASPEIAAQQALKFQLLNEGV